MPNVADRALRQLRANFGYEVARMVILTDGSMIETPVSTSDSAATRTGTLTITANQIFGLCRKTFS